MCFWAGQSHFWAEAMGRSSALLDPLHPLCSLGTRSWINMPGRAGGMEKQCQGTGCETQHVSLCPCSCSSSWGCSTFGVFNMSGNTVAFCFTFHLRAEDKHFLLWDLRASFPAVEIYRELIKVEEREYRSTMRLICNLITVGPDFRIRIRIAANMSVGNSSDSLPSFIMMS